MPETGARGAAWSSKAAMQGGLATLVVGSLAALLVIGWAPDRAAIVESLRSADRPLVFLAVVCLLAAHFADAQRLCWLCIAIESPVGYWRAFRAVLAGDFVGYITPFIAGGAPATVWALSRAGVSPGHGTAIVVAGGVISHIVLAVLAIAIPVAAILVHGQSVFSGLLLQAIVVVVPMNVAGSVLVVWASYGSDSVDKYLASWNAREESAPPSARRAKRTAAIAFLRAGIANYHDSFHELLKRGSAAGMAVFWSSVHFLLQFTVGYILLLALHVNVGYLQTLSAELVILMVASASPTPGGAGASEMGAFSLFSGLASQQIVFVFVLLWRLLTYWLMILLGAVAFVSILRKDAVPVGALPGSTGTA